MPLPFFLLASDLQLDMWADIHAETVTASPLQRRFDSSGPYPVLSLSQVHQKRKFSMVQMRSFPCMLEPALINGHRARDPSSCTAHSRTPSAIHRSPCLIPVQSFQAFRQVRPGQKDLYSFSRHSQETFAFAGIFEEWTVDERTTVRSCSVLHAKAPSLMQPFFESIPAILPTQDYMSWLTWTGVPIDFSTIVIRPLPSSDLKSWLALPCESPLSEINR